jgi:lactate dehydrogenase-like 2-hydroxyacid dehydrogenase
MTDETKSSIRGIAATGDAQINSRAFDQMPRVEIVSIFGAGFEGIDLEAARKRGIVVCNTPDVLTADVADLAIALWICAARQLVGADHHLRSGRWKVDGPPPLASSASGRRAGILGLGRIGTAIARRCRAMDMQVSYCGRRQREECEYQFYDTVEHLSGAVDVLFVACPGGPSTRHLVNRMALERLGPKGTLVNVSRGSVVDEAAMVDALLTNQLGAAGLDVFEREPDVPTELFALPNVVLTPHIGSATVEARKAMATQMVDNLICHFAGRELSNRLA